MHSSECHGNLGRRMNYTNMPFLFSLIQSSNQEKWCQSEESWKKEGKQVLIFQLIETNKFYIIKWSIKLWHVKCGPHIKCGDFKEAGMMWWETDFLVEIVAFSSLLPRSFNIIFLNNCSLSELNSSVSTLKKSNVQKETSMNTMHV